jgi:hypothetical protein
VGRRSQQPAHAMHKDRDRANPQKSQARKIGMVRVREVVIAGAHKLGNHGRMEAQQASSHPFRQSVQQHSRVASRAVQRPINQQTKSGKLRT